jgi:hypothetical protein
VPFLDLTKVGGGGEKLVPVSSGLYMVLDLRPSGDNRVHLPAQHGLTAMCPAGTFLSSGWGSVMSVECNSISKAWHLRERKGLRMQITGNELPWFLLTGAPWGWTPLTPLPPCRRVTTSTESFSTPDSMVNNQHRGVEVTVLFQ